MLPLLAVAALAADEPCYPHLWETRIAGEHFWIEWNPEVADEASALGMLDVLETTRALYVDEMGWALTDRAIVAGLEAPDEKGVSGQAQTKSCDGEHVPILQLYAEDFREGARQGTAAHELAHASQYAYTGQWIASASRLWWWMEGSATWLTVHANDNPAPWASSVGNYLGQPHMSLHHGVEAAFSDAQLSHMYGTALVAQVLDERHGGVETLRRTWEWAAANPDLDFWLPDVLADLDLDWDAFWAELLARAPTVDVEPGAGIGAGAALAATVPALPATGGEPEGLAPESLGFNVVRFDAGSGAGRKALEVRFDGDAGAAWHVVLVRADGLGPGSVAAYVPVRAEDGHATLWLSDFDRDAVAYLVVSPETRDRDAFGYAWSAALVDDPGPMAQTVTLREPPAGACGCSSGRPGAAWLVLGVVALLRRRALEA